MATRAEAPRSPGQAFYDRLQELLREAGFDALVEQVCKPHCAAKSGAPSLPPDRRFRIWRRANLSLESAASAGAPAASRARS